MYVCELVQREGLRSITSQRALAIIGVRAARLMSVAKALLSKPDSQQGDQYNLSHLGASFPLFFVIPVFLCVYLSVTSPTFLP